MTHFHIRSSFGVLGKVNADTKVSRVQPKHSSCLIPQRNHISSAIVLGTKISSELNDDHDPNTFSESSDGCD